MGPARLKEQSLHFLAVYFKGTWWKSPILCESQLSLEK